MTKTITFKQADKEVFEVLKEIKNRGWGIGGTLRMVLRVGTVARISEPQARLLCAYMAKGSEQYTQIFEALKEEVTIKLEEEVKEITLGEAMHSMNAGLATVRVEFSGESMNVRWLTDLKELEKIGIFDIDDLHKAKFFTVAD